MTNFITVSQGALDVALLAREVYAMETATKRSCDRFARETIAERREDLDDRFRSLAADLGFDVVPAAAKVREAAE